jgi:hypothetical protein
VDLDPAGERVTALPVTHRADAALAAAVLRHLDVQIDSARRMLELVLRQGAAIRARDVEAVVARLGEMRSEMELRERLEGERAALIGRAAASLGVPTPAVTLDALTALMPAADAGVARERSAELRGLLGEIAREHGINRALMRQELQFLDHLVRLLGSEPSASHRVVDLEA